MARSTSVLYGIDATIRSFRRVVPRFCTLVVRETYFPGNHLLFRIHRAAIVTQIVHEDFPNIMAQPHRFHLLVKPVVLVMRDTVIAGLFVHSLL